MSEQLHRDRPLVAFIKALPLKKLSAAQTFALALGLLLLMLVIPVLAFPWLRNISEQVLIVSLLVFLYLIRIGTSS